QRRGREIDARRQHSHSGWSGSTRLDPHPSASGSRLTPRATEPTRRLGDLIDLDTMLVGTPVRIAVDLNDLNGAAIFSTFHDVDALADEERRAVLNDATAISAYIEVARRHGLDPAQMAIVFAASRPFVTSTIIGATTM